MTDPALHMLTDHELAERVEAQRLLIVHEAREHLDVFLRHVLPIIDPGTDLKWGRYLDVMCEHLEAVSRHEIDRLLINLPPRHLKSILKVAFIAWIMVREPRTQFIIASHDMALSIRDSVAIRDLVTDEGFRQDFGIAWGIKGDFGGKTYWKNTEGGHVYATATGAKVTGHGADIILADDLLDEHKAWSEPARARAQAMIRSRLTSRFNDPETGRLVGIWQRLHEDDPNKWCEGDGQYQIVKLAMEYDPDHHPDGTILGDYEWRVRPGELLHPERMNAATVDKTRREYGPRAYAAQCLQRPKSDGDCILRAAWFQAGACPVPHNDGRAMCGIYLDPKAGSSSSSSSFAVALLIIRYEGRYYVADMERERCGYTGTKRMLKRMRTRYPDAPIIYENAADGRSFSTDEEFAREFDNCRAVDVSGGNTLQRLDLISGHVQSGEVVVHDVFPGDGPDSSRDHFMAEVTNLPGAANDDIADALSMGIRDLRGRARHVSPPSAPSRTSRNRPSISARGLR